MVQFPSTTNAEKIPVLFILMEFAPVNTTGNFRGLKFIKYLNKNFQAIVLTFVVKEGEVIFNTNSDESLLSELPSECVIYRIHCEKERQFF